MASEQTNNPSPSSHPSSHPGLNVAALERELNDLWKNLGEEDPHSGVTRTCVLNLIILARSSTVDYHLDETLIETTEKHAGRVILLTEEEDAAQPALDAWVTSRCTLPTAASRQVCCEQITIRASGESLRETPSAISSLVLSDLPVYLWWRDHPELDHPVFRRLAKLSDRVLVDSSLSRASEQTIGQIANYLAGNNRRTPLGDLNWTRLSTWRSIFASFYDMADYRQALDSAERLEISYVRSKSEGIAPRALYLTAWLGSRLGWKPVSAQRKEGGDEIVFRTPAGELRAHLIPLDEPADRPGHIEEAALTSSSAASSFTIKKAADGQRLSAEVALGADWRMERVMGYDQWSESALLERELEVLGTERVYEQAVELANKLIVMLAGAS